MRLTCPNCGAQYEVDADVIPENGRDVQCSSCGNTWFQKSESVKAKVSDRVSSEIPAEATATIPSDDFISETSAPPPPDPEPIGTIDQAFDESEPAKPSVGSTGLDQGVADILRKEAKRETAERSSDNARAENITDPIPKHFGKDEPAQSEQVDVDMSDLELEARSSLLPDIEEINSTLAGGQTSTDEPPDTELTAKNRVNGFRRGFIIAVVVFAILALVYVFARQIADAVPPLASGLSAYVDWINQLRESVDAMMLKAVDSLTGILAQLSDDTSS